jgi:hypothetical protein
MKRITTAIIKMPRHRIMIGIFLFSEGLLLVTDRFFPRPAFSSTEKVKEI